MKSPNLIRNFGIDFIETNRVGSQEHENGMLAPTEFCDSDSERIVRAALNITQKCQTDGQKAVRIFYWVRDSIKYELGLKGDRASETLAKGKGSCTNKACLAVALLRSLGIPAGFHIMEVKTKKYLGTFCTETFNRFMSEKSLHTYCAVNIGGRWVKFDPTDDIRLSHGIQHLCFQAQAIDFDGEQDACLNLDPDHIISDSAVQPSVDHILRKSPRIPSVAVEVLNFYLDFLRNNAIWNSTVTAIETEFFKWMQREEPAVYNAYVAHSQQQTSVALNEGTKDAESKLVEA